jgi:hypothetical protein
MNTKQQYTAWNHISIFLNLIFRIYERLLSDTISTVTLSTEIPEMYYVVASYPTNRISASNVRFRAGSSIRGSGGSLHPASQLTANPRYDSYTIDFDVAVVRVSDNVLLNLNFFFNSNWFQTRLMWEKLWFTI